MGFIDNIVDAVGNGLNSIGSGIIEAITTLIGKGLYYIIDYGLLSIVNIFYRLYTAFAGLIKVRYVENNQAEYDYLINVFFNNTVITNIYWAMAMIGIVLTFAFAIFAVVRKVFDINDRQKHSLGMILGSTFRSILLIVSLNVCIMAVMEGTNLLLQRVSYVFDNAYEFNQEEEITYSSQQYATMARVLNTIGNYSLNPSYSSRYNLNSCFNEIRSDLYDLQQQGVFDVYYYTEDSSGKEVNTWQSVLQSIVQSASLSSDLKMDVYYEGTSRALMNAMSVLHNDAAFAPLERYKRAYASASDLPMDRLLFLVGTISAARNDGYNTNVSFTDSVRGPFYSGEKDQYSLSAVMEDFEVGLGKMRYVLVALLAYMTIKSLWRCIVQCSARIFTLMGLYLIAPPCIATIPVDDGEKFRQWSTAFIIQTLGIFGTVVPMRLLIIFVPLILNEGLVIFSDSPTLNLIAKVLLIIGGLYAVENFGGIITGILSNNAGMQALRAGDTYNAKADELGAVGVGLAGSALAGGVKLTARTASFGAGAAAALGRGVGSLAEKAASYLKGDSAGSLPDHAGNLSNGKDDYGASQADANYQAASETDHARYESTGRNATQTADPVKRPASEVQSRRTSPSPADDEQFQNLYGISRQEYETARKNGVPTANLGVKQPESKQNNGSDNKAQSDEQFQKIFGISRQEYEASRKNGVPTGRTGKKTVIDRQNSVPNVPRPMERKSDKDNSRK